MWCVRLLGLLLYVLLYSPATRGWSDFLNELMIVASSYYIGQHISWLDCISLWLQNYSQWLYQQHWLFHHVSWQPVCWVVVMMMTRVGRPGAVTDMHLNQSRVNKVCVIVVVGVSAVFCPYCVSFVVLYFSCPYCSCPKSFLPLLLCPLSFLFPLLPWRAMVSLVVGSLIAPLCVERLSSRSGPVLWSGGWCCCCGSYWVCPFVGLVSWMYRNLGWILGPSIAYLQEGGMREAWLFAVMSV